MAMITMDEAVKTFESAHQSPFGRCAMTSWGWRRNRVPLTDCKEEARKVFT